MKINYIATYTTILKKKDRDYYRGVKVACIAETSNSHHASYLSPSGRAIVTGVECMWQRLTVAVSLLQISEVRVAKVNETQSCLIAIQAKQKPRVLHRLRNKRYVVPHKNRHRTSDV